MKNAIKSIVIAAALFFNITAKAQNAPKLENSLLWEVSGNGLSKPSYLYGTVHMICSGDYFLTEKTKKAFDASSKLVLEINFADPKETLEMQKLAMGKEPLSKKLSPEQLTKLDAILKRTSGMTVQQVDGFNMMTVMSLISMKSFGCTDLKFYELDFIEQAKKKNMTFGGLETVKSQFSILEGAYSNDEMIKMLEESDQEATSKLVEEYKKENIDALYDIITDKKVTSEKTKKEILDNRNLNWIKIMPELMEKETVFFAVGSAHLGGEFGVIDLLRKAGYSVKPVLN
ncbi:TraB/GumN family protein [Flavobacterium hungaricum]|uniref:TraB/GumN family protein n=1 Tax=Flavobacterium hungaricum TaxID=2082725 RepID=A0ABR9TQ27_9FLAO|nr:TraB/GumN family protein [Flavobacterium hungaricum]MBE8727448.1 TraB/GumN family protein [Flavobacterium hungaricum]